MKPFLVAAFTMALSLSPLRTAQGGSGKISGIVIQAGTAMPIDGVQIVLSPVTPVPGQPLNQVGAFTDQFGRFAVEDVPPGRYRIQWTRPGYFTPPVGTPGPDTSIIQSLKAQLGISALYIASPPAATSVTVELAAQEHLAGFVFTLIPGGVISGRVFDPMGNPLVSASLTALTLSYEDGRKVLRPGTSTTSDDRGNFRLFGLRPGEYYVRAEHRASAAVTSEIVRAYFPGVLGLGDAAPIVVNESGESPGANFSIPNGGTAKVSGTVNGPANMPRSNVQFSLFPIGPDHLEDPATFSIPNTASAENRAVGEFEIRGVSPGRHTLVAFVSDNVRQRSYSGSITLDIGTGDYRNVSIEMHPATDLPGRLMLEDGSPVRQAISLRARGTLVAPLMNSINVNTDGTFTISQVPEARYSITQNASDSCIVDIHQGGKSVYDEGFIGGMGAEPIEVVLSKQCGSVQVQILDDRKQPIPNAFVSLVPAAEHRSNVLLYRRSIFDVAGSRYPPINSIPPGEYKMFAWDNIPPNAELNAAFLARFEDRGVPVTVRRGESLTVQLSLITTKN
jgi:Carboxypeptidase regulatory-like domain